LRQNWFVFFVITIMRIPIRLRVAIRAAGIHFLFSLGVALLAALLVFGLWYPFPYRDLSGGRELFLLVTSVDVVCGPLLTLVIFSPTKPRAELWRDLSLVALIQLAALSYGLNTVWQARPLFLVLEVDRFKVIATPDLRGASLASLPQSLQPHWLSKPLPVTLRDPKDAKERETVLFESLKGGADYAERPDFYQPYDSTTAMKSLKKAKPLTVFLQKQPSQQDAAQSLATEKGASLAQWFYLPVVGRQDWVAVLDQQGQIQGFLKGDGF
jgi:hypothetical protein